AHAEVMDMYRSEHAPERTEAGAPSARVLVAETQRHAGILELREIHDARPRIGERRFLDREDVVDLIGRGHRLNSPRGHARASLAISASGRRTYSGRIAAGCTASDARATASRPIVPAITGGERTF